MPGVQFESTTCERYRPRGCGLRDNARRVLHFDTDGTLLTYSAAAERVWARWALRGRDICAARARPRDGALIIEREDRARVLG